MSQTSECHHNHLHAVFWVGRRMSYQCDDCGAEVPMAESEYQRRKAHVQDLIASGEVRDFLNESRYGGRARRIRNATK